MKKSLFYLTALTCTAPLLSVGFTVNSLADTNSGTGTMGTLRYCIHEANKTGGGPHTIQFSLGGTITLTQSLPPITTNISLIDGNSNGVTINGQNLYQAFFAAPSGGALTITNSGGNLISVTNGASIGGNGGTGASNGGGGALGAGGGLYVGENTTVTLEGVNFSNCFARGGNGGASQDIMNFGGGGGGGMQQGHGGSTTGQLGLGGGGGGGYGGTGGPGNNGGGGGGGTFFSGGGDPTVSVQGGGGGGGSNENPGDPPTGTIMGGNGGSTTLNAGGAGGNENVAGGAGVVDAGAGGGGAEAAPGGDSARQGAGGGGGGVDASGAKGGSCLGSFGGGGGAGAGGTAPQVGGNGGLFGGGGGGSVPSDASVKNGSAGGNGGVGPGGAVGHGGGGGAGDSAQATAVGGNGGFGGGGGGGYSAANAGLGGYGAGHGGSMLSSGGGGAALGGTIFVARGGTLILKDTLQSSITSGASLGGTGANHGHPVGPSDVDPYGVDIFLMSGGTIEFQQSSTFIATHPIVSEGGSSLLGGVKMNGTGTVVLSGLTNSYTGSTTIQQGTVQITSDANLGASTAPLVFTGAMASDAILSVNSSTTLPSTRSITMTGSGTIHIPHFAGTVTIASVISGAGSDLFFTGSGVASLTGSNTYSSITTIDPGATVQIFTSGNLGSGAVHINEGILEASGSLFLTNPIVMQGTGGTIAVDSGKDVFLLGGLTGTAATKTFLGELTLLSNWNLTGDVTVQQGLFVIPPPFTVTAPSVQVRTSANLLLNGTIAGDVQVDSFGVLKGDGTVTGTTTVDGFVYPQGPVGFLTTNNFVSNGTSTFLTNIDNTTATSIVVGTAATIQGGEIQLVPNGFTIPSVSSYTLLTAGALTVNTPYTLVNPFTRYPFQLDFTATQILLLLASPPIPFDEIVTKGNAGKVARCFEQMYLDNFSDLSAIVQVLDVQTPQEMANSFNQMQPSKMNATAFAQENIAERTRQIFTDHFIEERQMSCPTTDDGRVWGALFTERVHQREGYVERFNGVTLGLDHLTSEHWIVSGGFTFSHGQATIARGRDRAHFKTYGGTLGGAWRGDHFFADLIVSYQRTPLEGTRKMTFSAPEFPQIAPVKRSASHSEHSNLYLGHIGTNYTVRWDDYHLYPFVNVDYQYLFQSNYREHGAQSLNLKVKQKQYDYLRPEIGFGVGYRGCFEKLEALVDVGVSYIHELRFIGKWTTARFAPVDCRFTVKGPKPQNQLVSPVARVRFTSPGTGFSVAFGYHGEYGKHFSLTAGELEARLAF